MLVPLLHIIAMSKQVGHVLHVATSMSMETNGNVGGFQEKSPFCRTVGCRYCSVSTVIRSGAAVKVWKYLILL